MLKRFTVLNHEYVNTGGGNMVSKFTVYDKQLRATRYVVANRESMVYAAIDTVDNELDADDFWDAVIYHVENDELTPDIDRLYVDMADDEWNLLKYCEFEHYKQHCKHDGCRVLVSTGQLPIIWCKVFSQDCQDWHMENDECFTTDGYNVWPSPAYIDQL